MREEVIKIGEVRVFNRPVVMKCYGLGTCIGLFVKDRVTGITGGAHIFLPQAYINAAGDEGISAEDCVKLMLQQMKEKGASLETLRAKIVGGANPLMQFHEVGTKNTEAVLQALIRNKVFIAAMDVGGKVSRTAKFNAASEELVVHQLEKNTVKIF